MPGSSLDVGLYVHVPFCRSKCGYCDFYSLVPSAGQTGPLVDALLAELHGGPLGEKSAVRARTIFVGGGTPTVLPLDALRRLMAALGRIAARDRVGEFTVEANPATVDDGRADLLREAGVNRLSIGIQSFRPAELEVLDRTHRPEDVPRTVAAARRAGFRRLAADLMFGVPGQTPESWAESLSRTIELGFEHISCYGLTYESGTPLRERLDRRLIAACDEEAEAGLYELAMEKLAAAGFEQYEISNFARPGERCVHNVAYWHDEPYVGVGPSAAGYLTGIRTRNVADAEEYVRRMAAGRSPVDDRECLGPEAQAGEFAMLALRMTEGLDRARFLGRYGRDPVAFFGETILRHSVAGRLLVTPSHVRLTPAGLMVADSVIEDFIWVAGEK